MKTKLTNIVRGRKERKNRCAKLNRGRQGRFVYVKDLLQREENSRKSKQRNNCRKKYVLKIKIKKKGKKKRKLH